MDKYDCDLCFDSSNHFENGGNKCKGCPNVVCNECFWSSRSFCNKCFDKWLDDEDIKSNTK